MHLYRIILKNVFPMKVLAVVKGKTAKDALIRFRKTSGIEAKVIVVRL